MGLHRLKLCYRYRIHLWGFYINVGAMNEHSDNWFNQSLSKYSNLQPLAKVIKQWLSSYQGCNSLGFHCSSCPCLTISGVTSVVYSAIVLCCCKTKFWLILTHFDLWKPKFWQKLTFRIFKKQNFNRNWLFLSLKSKILTHLNSFWPYKTVFWLILIFENQSYLNPQIVLWLLICFKNSAKNT